MKMGTELWLVRHGETEWSLSGKHTSRTDVPLTNEGRHRAEVLRDYLAGRKFDLVLVSPMQRARETCAIAGYGDVAVVDDGLKEWDYGVYEGKTTTEIRAEVPGWSVWKNEIVGGETVEQVGERGGWGDCEGAGGEWGYEAGAAVCACAYSADTGGAMGGAGGGGRADLCAGDGEFERTGVGTGDAGCAGVESRV